MRASPTTGELTDAVAVILGGEALPDRGGARDLIAALMDKPRFWPSAHREAPVDDALADLARSAATRMRTGMPFAYAVGKADFRHLTLGVDQRVLIPRPETELLVDLAMAATDGRGVVADVGTGSGAIALALAAEGSFDAVIATDLSDDALAVARGNLAAIPAPRAAIVELRHGDLCEPLAGTRIDAIVSNPPYIANSERADLPPSVREWEPALALFSGDDGMDAIRRLLAGAAGILAPGGSLLVEIDARRGALSRACASADGRWTEVTVRQDLTGRDRFLCARRSRA